MIRPFLAALAASLLVASAAVAAESIDAAPGGEAGIDDRETMAGEEADLGIAEDDLATQPECDKGISMSPDELVASLNADPC